MTSSGFASLFANRRSTFLQRAQDLAGTHDLATVFAAGTLGKTADDPNVELVLVPIAADRSLSLQPTKPSQAPPLGTSLGICNVCVRVDVRQATTVRYAALCVGDTVVDIAVPWRRQPQYIDYVFPFFARRRSTETRGPSVNALPWPTDGSKVRIVFVPLVKEALPPSTASVMAYDVVGREDLRRDRVVSASYEACEVDLMWDKNTLSVVGALKPSDTPPSVPAVAWICGGDEAKDALRTFVGIDSLADIWTCRATTDIPTIPWLAVATGARSGGALSFDSSGVVRRRPVTIQDKCDFFLSLPRDSGLAARRASEGVMRDADAIRRSLRERERGVVGRRRSVDGQELEAPDSDAVVRAEDDIRLV